MLFIILIKFSHVNIKDWLQKNRDCVFSYVNISYLSEAKILCLTLQIVRFCHLIKYTWVSDWQQRKTSWNISMHGSYNQLVAV